MKKILYILIIIPAILLSACSSSSSSLALENTGQSESTADLPYIDSSIKDLSDEEKIYGLSLLWKEANYNFAFWDKAGLPDWDNAYKEALPRVLATRNTYEYYMELSKFFALLQDGHTDITLPKNINDRLAYLPFYMKNMEGSYYIIGAGNGMSNKMPIFSKVTKINGIPLQEYLDENVYPYIWHQKVSSAEQKINDALSRGYAGTSETITCITPDGVTKDIEVKRVRRVTNWVTIPVRKSAVFTSDVYQDNNMQIKMINDIAYINLATFDNDTMPDRFYEQLSKIKDAKGFIIDVRANGGGNSGNAEKIAAAFTGGHINTGGWRSLEHIAAYKAWKQGSYANTKNYRSWSSEMKYYDVGFDLKQPVVILTSRYTASAAEDFLIYFDAVKRGTRVGEPTYGSTGQPLFIDLPGGGSARICTRHCLMADGTDFINVGIAPDVLFEQSIDDLKTTTDSVLIKGLEVLKEETGE